MMTSAGDTTRLRDWARRLPAERDRVMDELLRHVRGRLTRLTSRMLGRFPDVRREEQTDDVFQAASARLEAVLRDVPLKDSDHFFNLAARLIRQELIRLARHHKARPRRMVTLEGDDPDEVGGRLVEDPTDGPGPLAEWAEFHGEVGKLPEDLRGVFDLIWYHGLSQVEAARALGVSEKTVQRRWIEARLAIREALDGRPPGM
jgi:RNA polymerase sigma factor (sigma-70 family)